MLFGSHLDSQPSGGKFDGALGVLAGLEVMRSLNDLGIVTEAPLELVNWTDEEGSRFGHSLMGSGVWAGVFPLDKAYALTDIEGVTVRTALDGIGYRGAEPAARLPGRCLFRAAYRAGADPGARGESRSASSPARRRRSGTTRSRPARTSMPAPRRPRPARTRWCAPRGSSTWWTA